MISKKEDYRFVSQASLKYVSVGTKPYPARNQKIVPLAVDWAFMREAVTERQALLEQNSERGTSKAQRTVDRDIDRTFYGEGTLGGGIKGLVSGGRLYSSAEVEKMNMPSIPAYQGDTHWVTEEWRYIREDDQRIFDAADKSLEDGRKARDERIKDLNKAFDDAKEALDKKIEEEDDAAAEKKASDEKEEDAAYYEEVDADKKEYDADVKRIEEETRAELERISEQIEKEEDLKRKAELELEYEKASVGGKRELEERREEYETACARRDDGHGYRLAEIERVYTDEKMERHAKYDKDVADITKTRDDGIADAHKTYDDLCWSIDKGLGWSWDYGRPSENVPLREYEAQTKKANVTKSCAEEFYGRLVTFDMASTPLNRLFADLEHMDVVRLDGVGRSGVAALHWRPATWKYYDYDYFHGEWSPFGPDSFGAGSVIARDGENMPNKIGLYFGDRQTADVLKKIYVDMLVRLSVRYVVGTGSEPMPYDREWSKNTEYKAGEYLHYAGSIEEWTYITEWPTMISEWKKVGDKDVEIRFKVMEDFKSGDSIGIYVDNPPPWGYHQGYNIGPCEVKVLKRQFSTETEYYSYSMQRVELSRTRCGGKVVDRIDECYDKYIKDRADIAARHDEKIEELDRAYEEECGRIEEKYESECADAEDVYEREVVAAREKRVRSACADAAAVNAAIDAEEDEKKRQALLKAWERDVLDPAETVCAEEERAAENKRDETLEKAASERNDAIKKIREPYLEERSELVKARNKELAERYEKKGYDEEGKYVTVGGYVKEKKDIIDEMQTNPLKRIREEYEDKADEASDQYSEDCAKAYSEFKDSVSKMELPLEDYSLPLEWEEWAYLEYYDRIYGTNYYNSYRAAESAWRNKEEEALKKCREALREARMEEWTKMLEITAESQNARDLWEGSFSLPEDTSRPPRGEDEPSKSSVCTVLLARVWAMAEPKTLTGVDFKEYYEELEEKG